jgi:hypothetical protein
MNTQHFLEPASSQARFRAWNIGLALLLRYVAPLVLALTTLLLPVKEARAESAIDVLFTVCDKVQGLCGKHYKEVAQGCFLKTSNELDCALSIINLSSGGQSGNGIKQVNAIIDCIKTAPDIANKAKFDATCRPLLQQAGVDVGKIDEVYSIAGRCSNADDVDDFIYCADTLLDSSIVESADIGVPTWVNSLFDIYIDIDQKDYWGLVKDVGATVACAVANYFLGADVCAFLDDIVEFAGDVTDGVVAIGRGVNNEGEKLLQSAHEPIGDFYTRYWLPDADVYAQNIVVKKNSGYWSPTTIGEKMKHCRNYFESHRMATDKACRVCVDMRDGMTGQNECNKPPTVAVNFSDQGFTQLASRRGAIMLLPSLVKSAANTRLAQLRAQGALSSPKLPGPQMQFDPWKSAPEVPGVEAFIYRLYGLGNHGEENDAPPMKRDAQTLEAAWRTKTVGFGAYMIAQVAKLAPGTLNYATSEAIALKAIASGEAGIDIATEVKKFIQTAQEARMVPINSLVSINSTMKNDRDKPLNDMLALCEPKATALCQDEVRERFKVCDAKSKAYADANAGVMGDFDNKRGQDALKKWGEIRMQCESEVQAYVMSLPNVVGDFSGTQSCKLYLGRTTELLCPDAGSALACHKLVDIGKLKTCRQVGLSEPYTKPSGHPATGAGTVRPGLPTGLIATTPLTGAMGSRAPGGAIGGSFSGNAAPAPVIPGCTSTLNSPGNFVCTDMAARARCEQSIRGRGTCTVRSLR